MTPEELLREAYRGFNARDIDAVLALMHDDVVWPNGMEGGIVRGHAAVREYWTWQWTLVEPQVDPLQISRAADGRYDVEVKQLIKDMAGNVVLDRVVHHLYTFRGDRIESMEIVEPWDR